MSTTPHARAQLSAHLDGALGPAERSAVEAHLDTCADCRTRLAELRATAALIGSLADPVPTRRLVPRVAPPPPWLAPLRTLSTVASGVSVFLFIASALLGNVATLSGGGTGAAPAPQAAPAAGAAAPSAATERGASAPRSASPASLADTAKQATASSTVPGNAFAATSPTPADAVARSETIERRVERAIPSIGTPWLWLGLAIVTAAIAIALQRRLRSA